MSDDRKPLPETGFRCYPAKPAAITCNMTIIVDDMIKWLQSEKASGQNLKKNRQGQDTIKLTMLESKKQDAKVSHFFAYDDFEPNSQGGNQGGGYQQPPNNVRQLASASPPNEDIPF